MKNYRGGGSRYREVVTAAAPRTSGVPCIDNGYAGVPETTAATGVRYTLRRDGEFEFPIGGTPAKGDDLFINQTTFALTSAAHGTAAAGGTQLFGRITAVPGDPNTALSTDAEPATGFVWASIGTGGSGS